MPILRQKLKDLNSGVITDDARADGILTRLRGIPTMRNGFPGCATEQTYKFSAEENAETIR